MSYRDAFEDRWRRYDLAMKLWPAARAAEFHALLEWDGTTPDQLIPPGSVVLDLPSMGGYLAPFLPRGVELITADFCGDLSQLVVPEPGHAPMNLPPCDVVVCMAAMHHIEESRMFFEELRQALRPGGRVLIGDVARGSKEARFLDRHIPGHSGRYREWIKRPAPDGFIKRRWKHRPVPWVFASQGDMGMFCQMLFGLDACTTEAEIIRQIGGSSIDQGEFSLQWELDYVELLLQE